MRRAGRARIRRWRRHAWARGCASPAPAAATSWRRLGASFATTGWISRYAVDVATGVALILVDDAGENQIVAIPGANDSVGSVLTPRSTSRSGRDPAGCGRGHARHRVTGATVQPVSGPILGARRRGDVAIVNDRSREASAARRRDAGERGPYPPGAHGALALPARASSIRPAPATRSGALRRRLGGRSLEDARVGIATASPPLNGPAGAGDAEASEVEERMRVGAGLTRRPRRARLRPWPGRRDRDHGGARGPRGRGGVADDGRGTRCFTTRRRMPSGFATTSSVLTFLSPPAPTGRLSASRTPPATRWRRASVA